MQDCVNNMAAYRHEEEEDARVEVVELAVGGVGVLRVRGDGRGGARRRDEDGDGAGARFPAQGERIEGGVGDARRDANGSVVGGAMISRKIFCGAPVLQR